MQKPVRKPFAPTTRKVTDLFDALRSVTIIETDKAPPSWFDTNDVPADELIACENGLSAAPAESKIAIVASQKYFMETLTENPRALSAL